MTDHLQQLCLSASMEQDSAKLKELLGSIIVVLDQQEQDRRPQKRAVSAKS